MRSVTVVQHFWCEDLGTIAAALAARGIAAQYVRTFQGERVPGDLGNSAGLIVMGGPMGVYEDDRYPFLREDLRLIEWALCAERPVLGVCLGSQLLAAALGAAVARGAQKEIGWHPVTLSAEAAADDLWAGVASPFVAYHWHGDVFPLPEGAALLAASGQTACQAFRYGRNAYGFLFHLEVTQQIIAAMAGEFAEEAHAAGVDGAAVLAEVPTHLSQLHEIGDLVFGKWAALLD